MLCQFVFFFIAHRRLKKKQPSYIFFWVFPWRQIVVGRRFGTLYQFHLQRLGVQCLSETYSRVCLGNHLSY